MLLSVRTHLLNKKKAYFLRASFLSKTRQKLNSDFQYHWRIATKVTPQIKAKNNQHSPGGRERFFPYLVGYSSKTSSSMGSLVQSFTTTSGLWSTLGIFKLTEFKGSTKRPAFQKRVLLCARSCFPGFLWLLLRPSIYHERLDFFKNASRTLS